MEAADVQGMQPYTFNAAPMGTFGESLEMLTHRVADFQHGSLLHRNRTLQHLLSQRNIAVRAPSPPTVVTCMPSAVTPARALGTSLVTNLYGQVTHPQHPPALYDTISPTEVADMWAIIKDPKDVINSGNAETCDARTSSDDEVANLTNRHALVTSGWSITQEQRQLLNELFPEMDMWALPKDPKDVINSGTEETCDARASSDDEVASRHNDAPQSSTKRRALVAPRWSITRGQRQLLEELFKVEPVPSRAMAENIAEQFGVSTQQIKVWFRNQRQKVRLGQRSAS